MSDVGCGQGEHYWLVGGGEVHSLGVGRDVVEEMAEQGRVVGWDEWVAVDGAQESH